MGPWAQAIEDELEIQPEQTIAAAERRETAGLLQDIVNLDTKRVMPKLADEQPRGRRYLRGSGNYVIGGALFCVSWLCLRTAPPEPAEVGG